MSVKLKTTAEQRETYRGFYSRAGTPGDCEVVYELCDDINALVKREADLLALLREQAESHASLAELFKAGLASAERSANGGFTKAGMESALEQCQKFAAMLEEE